MIDKRLLIDSVTIEKVIGRDEWGKEAYGDKLSLSPVRFDRSTTLKHNSQNAKDEIERKPGIVFVYTKFCPVSLDESYIDGRLTDGNLSYRVVGLIPISLFKKQIGYEIEVV